MSESQLVLVDGRDDVAYVLIRNAGNGRVSAEAAANGITRNGAAALLLQTAKGWIDEDGPLPGDPLSELIDAASDYADLRRTLFAMTPASASREATAQTIAAVARLARAARAVQ